ncbi:MAG: hypothetical protein ACP5UO_02730 [Thermoplasmata archaeon]
MDIIPGIVALALSILATLAIRALIIRAMWKGSRVVLRDLKISSVDGLNPGIMTYLISIITIILGPFSFRVYNVTSFSYLILNVAAGVFFSITYPYFSPVTSFSTVDLYEKKGRKFCIAGKVINRKLEVISVKEEITVELNVRCGRSVCRITAVNPAAFQRSS